MQYKYSLKFSQELIQKLFSHELFKHYKICATLMLPTSREEDASQQEFDLPEQEWHMGTWMKKQSKWVYLAIEMWDEEIAVIQKM